MLILMFASVFICLSGFYYLWNTQEKHGKYWAVLAMGFILALLAESIL